MKPVSEPVNQRNSVSDHFDQIKTGTDQVDPIYPVSVYMDQKNPGSVWVDQRKAEKIADEQKHPDWIRILSGFRPCEPAIIDSRTFEPNKAFYRPVGLKKMGFRPCCLTKFAFRPCGPEKSSFRPDRSNKSGFRPKTGFKRSEQGIFSFKSCGRKKPGWDRMEGKIRIQTEWKKTAFKPWEQRNLDSGPLDRRNPVLDGLDQKNLVQVRVDGK